MSMQAAMPAEEDGGPPKKLSALDKFRMNAKKALLAWTENAITKYVQSYSCLLLLWIVF